MATKSKKPDSTMEHILANDELRTEWIKFQLRIYKSSLADIARELGVTRQTVQQALSSPYPKMERAIALKIGLQPSVIWPERYQTAA